MTMATAEANEPHMNVEEQARVVSGLLKEYVDKLAALNADLLDVISDPYSTARASWLLDQGDLLRKPLAQIISRGSGLLEHANLDTITEDELSLRMQEIEIHLHHAFRLTHELKQVILATGNTLVEQVAKLRVAAGLNAMKGGPLRPND